MPLSPLCQLFLLVLLIQKNNSTIPHVSEHQGLLFISAIDTDRGASVRKTYKWRITEAREEENFIFYHIVLNATHCT